MPKTIDPYRKIPTLSVDVEPHLPLPKLVPLAILVIALVFCFCIGNDASNQMEIVERSKVEEAKLCMLEFT